jgi:hypothetical protein
MTQGDPTPLAVRKAPNADGCNTVEATASNGHDGGSRRRNDEPVPAWRGGCSGSGRASSPNPDQKQGRGGIRTREGPNGPLRFSRLISFGSTMRSDAGCATQRATVVRYTPSLTDIAPHGMRVGVTLSDQGRGSSPIPHGEFSSPLVSAHVGRLVSLPVGSSLIALTCAHCAAVGCVASKPPPAGSATVTKCVWPTFRGRTYRPHALRKTSLPVAERVGRAVVYRNYNLNCFREERFVHRLPGIAIGRAVSLDGSRRKLLIRSDVCLRAPYEAALVRCLKRAA